MNHLVEFWKLTLCCYAAAMCFAIPFGGVAGAKFVTAMVATVLIVGTVAMVCIAFGVEARWL